MKNTIITLIFKLYPRKLRVINDQNPTSKIVCAIYFEIEGVIKIGGSIRRYKNIFLTLNR